MKLLSFSLMVRTKYLIFLFFFVKLGMSVSDVARELGVRWKQAPVELKTKYEQAAIGKKTCLSS